MTVPRTRLYLVKILITKELIITAEDNAEDALEVGDKMADGTIYAGISPDTGKQIFAMPIDAGGPMTFIEAAIHTTMFNIQKALDHDDWRAPTRSELRILYDNCATGAFQSTFTTEPSKTSDLPHWYWSSTEDLYDPSLVCVVRFSDGFEDWEAKDLNRLSCRPVRP